MASLKTSLIVYNWVFKFIGAALLIGFGLTLWLADAERLVEAFIGILIAGYALIRVVPFIKTQRSDLIKTINIVEIVLNLLVAAVFIATAFLTEDGLGAVFGYAFGAVLIGRGMVHFYGLSHGTEKGDHPTYFFHVATLIVGTLIIVEGYTVEHLIYLMLFLTVVSGGYLTFDAYGGYNNYRRRKQMEQPKSVEKVPEIDTPRKEDPAKDQDQIVS